MTQARRLSAAGESEASWAQRPCAWRHSSDLKQALPYRAAWEGREARGCRCICQGTERRLRPPGRPEPSVPPKLSSDRGGAVKLDHVEL